MSLMIRRDQRGVTLVELMVVVVIIGVLGGLAFVMFRGRPGLQETAQQMSNHIREAARKAVAGGIVEQSEVDVGSTTVPPSARSRVSIVYDSAEDRQFVSVEMRDEFLANTPVEAEWQVVASHYLRDGIVIYGYDNALYLNSGSGTGDAFGSGGSNAVANTVRGPGPASSGTETTVDIYFNPDGSVATAPGGASRNPRTLFVLDTGGGQQEARLRVVVLPLQGQPLVFGGW